MNKLSIKINIKENEIGKVILLTGSLDIYTSMQLKNKIERISIKKDEVIVIDLSDVKYLDSSGISSLIKVVNRVREFRAEFYITGLKKIIQKIFKVAGLMTYFNILSQEEYMKKFPSVVSEAVDRES